ncbi:MAG: SDR family oxidoreductase [bacterium]|nr:SDR family oxidoreductase [bacterium]
MDTQTVLVTGAAKGIGRATAVYLAERGMTVFAGVRTAKDGDALRAQSPRMHPLILDIANPEHIAAAAETIRTQVGERGLDGLVNNAGIAVAAPLEFVPLDDFRWQIEINLTAQLALTQALLPCLRAARASRIINVTSVGGRIAGRMMGPYHASKFAFEALTDTLRQELRPWGIHAIAIEPGAIATPMWESGTQTAGALIAKMPPQAMTLYGQIIDRMRESAPGNMVTGAPPEKVAAVIYKALTHPRPRTRYTVGTDALIGDRVLRLLPDRLRDSIMARR